MSDDSVCPQCGGPTALGYGFAGGGGVGAWAACLDCDWMSKEVDVAGESLRFAPAGPDDGELE